MGKAEKKYLFRSLLLTVVTIILMALTAIVLPKGKLSLILVIEIGLAVLWTVISAINLCTYLRENKNANNKSK